VLHIATHRRTPYYRIEILTNDNKIITSATATPDCGAEATVAGIEVLNLFGELKNNLLPGNGETLVAANGEPLTAIGQLNVQLRYKGRKSSATIIFCIELKGILLSWFTCVELGILPPNFPEPAASIQQIHSANIPELKASLLDEFADVFDFHGPLRTMVGAPMKIKLIQNAVPFAVNGARPIPFAQREEVKKLLDDKGGCWKSKVLFHRSSNLPTGHIHW
jgi:hypothetical protein